MTTSWNAMKFDAKASKWSEINLSEPKFETSLPQSINVGAYNILVDSCNPLVTHPTKRYNYHLSTLFPKIDLDILCLNEVAQSYFTKLANCAYIQNTYYISHTKPRATKRKYFSPSHEVVILSKFPFRVYNLSNSCRYVCGLFTHTNASTNNSNDNSSSNTCHNDESKEENKSQTEEKKELVLEQSSSSSYLVIATHLKPFKRNMKNREKEMKEICKMVAKLPHYEKDTKYKKELINAIANNNIILLGDMNFRIAQETNFIYDNDFLDVWLEIKQRQEKLMAKKNVNNSESMVDRNGNVNSDVGTPKAVLSEEKMESKNDKDDNKNDDDDDTGLNNCIFDNNGYTWDGKANSMIGQMLPKPFNQRQMRLDRILLKENCSLFDHLSLEWKHFEIFGKVEIDNKLYPSDHFGISVKLPFQMATGKEMEKIKENKFIDAKMNSASQNQLQNEKDKKTNGNESILAKEKEKEKDKENECQAVETRPQGGLLSYVSAMGSAAIKSVLGS